MTRLASILIVGIGICIFIPPAAQASDESPVEPCEKCPMAGAPDCAGGGESSPSNVFPGGGPTPDVWAPTGPIPIPIPDVVPAGDDPSDRE